MTLQMVGPLVKPTSGVRLDHLLVWDAGHPQHLRYSIPMVLDSIDLQITFRTRIFIRILGYVVDSPSPSSLILLCTLLSLFVGHLFSSHRISYRIFVYRVLCYRSAIVQ